jgi:hypothetical protein
MEKNQIVFFVGDVTSDLEKSAKQLDPTAQLITQQNCFDIGPGVYYVSLGDFTGLAEFARCLDQADQLIYCAPEVWTSQDMQYWTEYYMMYFYSHKTVTGFQSANTRTKYLELQDQRQSNGPQLWIAGCSVSHGDNVEHHEKYGLILANRMNLPVSFLTMPGSSIGWAADQILRSDIRGKDTVVWGITSPDRFAFFDHTVQHVTQGYYQRNPEFDKKISMETLTDENTIYQALTKIFQVIEFCKKTQVNLIVAGILVQKEFLEYLYDLPNFIQLWGAPECDWTHGFLDLGSDQQHPGPLTHQWYADQLYKKIVTYV